jgi:hypothetical protein
MDNRIIEKNAPPGLDRPECFNRRQAVLGQWQHELQERLEEHGGEVIPHSLLSLSGPAVDNRVPVDSIDAAESEVSGISVHRSSK